MTSTAKEPLLSSDNKQQTTNDVTTSRARKSLQVLTPEHASVSQTTISIIKCFIGAASFELPYAIKNGGLVGALCGVLALAFASFYTLRILARCGELLETKRSSTYPEIGYAAVGNVSHSNETFPLEHYHHLKNNSLTSLLFFTLSFYLLYSLGGFQVGVASFL